MRKYTMALIQGLLICGLVVALMSLSAAQEVEDMCSLIDCLPGQKCAYDFTVGAKCVCRRDTDCPASSSPLCGSDGKSYKNHCIMKATACRESRRIEQVKAGSCLPNNACQIKPTSPCRGFFPRFYFNVTTQKCEKFIAGGCHPSGWNGFREKKECKDQCIVVANCKEEDAPPPLHGIRIGNGFTAGSVLKFGCDEGYDIEGQTEISCLQSGKWNVSPPICKDKCSRIDCLPGQKCVHDFTVGAKCVCRRDIDCPASSSPLCGSDGKSYQNHCIMNATACRESRHIEPVKTGPCLPNNACQIKPISPCRGFFPRFYFNVTTQKCEKFIAGGCHPSGWNGFREKKECKDQCIDTCKTTKCPLGQKCVHDIATGAKCVCRINADCPTASLGPLCGSDGKFYINRCNMEAAACRQAKVITKVKAGRCLPDNACQIKPTSPCRAFFEHFYFNVTTQKCEKFIAGGCHPSGWNGFHTKKKCSDTCSDKPSCPPCPRSKVRRACRNSSLVIVGQVSARLKEARNLTRYIMNIQSVLKSTGLSLPEGKAVLSIPYEDSPDCACPRLPLNKTVILDSSEVQIKKNSSKKTGITLSGKVFMFEWSSDIVESLKRKCAKHAWLFGKQE